MSAAPRSPWAWIPSLYLLQGLPYVVVMTLSVVMYKNLGLSNTDIALYTSWLYLPWVIKPLWSPLIELLGTKRRWIWALQFVVGALLAGVALTLPLPNFFQMSLAVLWLMAFASASHDIAADGFYMLALKTHQQAAFVGVRSTFYRVANIAGQGGLVYLAGELTERSGSAVFAWQVVMTVLAVMFVLLAVWHLIALPQPTGDSNSSKRFAWGKFAFGFVSLTCYVLIATYFATLAAGFIVWFAKSAVLAVVPYAIAFLPALLWVTHWLRSIARRLPSGVALTGERVQLSDEFGFVLVEFLRKPSILTILGFLLLYRFPEAQLLKLATPFLLDPVDQGGLGLSTKEVGIAYGTVGLVSLTLGGIVGGLVIARVGLKKALWPLILAMHVPNVVFLAMALSHPGSLWIVCAALAVEQFGYGLGFTAYLMVMILVAEGPHKTAHYAICTGFMALGMMLPGMWSGWLQDQLGYVNFFVWVLIATLPSFAMTALIRVPEGFGKKEAA
ncbi:MFS transporter [Inhella crocodyli]|uniref:MFS transporter n=1 Tax=Inhella crocodyli TaxID=2499851 RepID=A0A437LQA0_9BURK|nr:MFS transporter [Inhella crocodyli]RVT87582.1 MFS transporter [Inhella crocodyli]